MRWIAIALLGVAGALHAGEADEHARLWALILDPSTPQSARMDAVRKANFELPLAYVEIAMNAELELRREATREPQPWHAGVLEALERLDISTGYLPGMELVRKMPCASEMEEQLMYRNLERFRMTPELYGVLRNLVARHDGEIITKREWFGWADYGRRDDEIWWASQAFVAELAPAADREMVKRLGGIVYRMLHEGDNTPSVAVGGVPNTALLALVERIEAIAEDPKTHCWLAGEASLLLDRHDLPQIPADALTVSSEGRSYPMWDPDTYANVDECHAWIGKFRAWLAAHRRGLEEGAALERDAIAKARTRMLAEELCR